MASALVSLKNSVAVFTVAAAGTTTDPETGNVTANTQTLTYDLYLRKVGTESVSLYPGVDTRSAVYEGYCINPQTLDRRIVGGVTATLSFAGDPPEECEVEDARFAYGTTGLLGATLQSVLGDKIRLLRTWQANV